MGIRDEILEILNAHQLDWEVAVKKWGNAGCSEPNCDWEHGGKYVSLGDTRAAHRLHLADLLKELILEIMEDAR